MCCVVSGLFIYADNWGIMGRKVRYFRFIVLYILLSKFNTNNQLLMIGLRLNAKKTNKENYTIAVK